MAYAPTRPKVLHVGAKAGQLLVPVRRMDLKPHLRTEETLLPVAKR